MNTKLIKKMQLFIAKQPKQFDIRWWFSVNAQIPNCHTAACFAGLAVALSRRETPGKAAARFLDKGGKFYRGNPIHKQAILALQITPAQADRLFHLHNWPSKFFHGYCENDPLSQPRQNAKAAIARLQHFIRTKGEE